MVPCGSHLLPGRRRHVEERSRIRALVPPSGPTRHRAAGHLARGARDRPRHPSFRPGPRSHPAIARVPHLCRQRDRSVRLVRGVRHRVVRRSRWSSCSGADRARMRRGRVHDARTRTDHARDLQPADEPLGRSAPGAGSRDVRRLSGRRRTARWSHLSPGRPFAPRRAWIPGGIDRARVRGHRDRPSVLSGSAPVPGRSRYAPRCSSGAPSCCSSSARSIGVVGSSGGTASSNTC